MTTVRELYINGKLVGSHSSAPGAPMAMAIQPISFLTSDTFMYVVTNDEIDTEPLEGHEYGTPDDPPYPSYRFVARILETMGNIDPMYGDYLNFKLVSEHIVDGPNYAGRHEYTFVPEAFVSKFRPLDGQELPMRPLRLHLYADCYSGRKQATMEKLGWYDFTRLFPFPEGAELTASKLAASWQGQLTMGIQLLQDEVDTLRQEYVDYGGVPPRRDEVKAMGPPRNNGNYSLGLDLNGQLMPVFEQVLAEYRSRPVVYIPGPPPAAGYFDLLDTTLTFDIYTSDGKAVYIPPAAILAITSGYRCPRRNVFKGSEFPVTSRHVWGAALDITPAATNGVRSDGVTVPLDLHQHIYPTLLKAARKVKPNAIAERGPKALKVGDPREDHIHLQW